MTDKEFESIIHETKPAVLSAIRRYLSNHLSDHVDDIAQTTYLKAYVKLKKVSPTEIKSLTNYLYTIAKNESLKWNIKEQKLINTYKLIESEFTPEEKEEKDVNVHDLIKTLPQPYEEVWDLFCKGLKLKQISEHLNLTLNTVKTRLFRGKKLIQKQWGGELK